MSGRWRKDDEDEDEDEHGYGGEAAIEETYIFKDGENINGPVGDNAWLQEGSPEREEVLNRRVPKPVNCCHNPEGCRACDGFASFTAFRCKRRYCKDSSSVP